MIILQSCHSLSISLCLCISPFSCWVFHHALWLSVSLVSWGSSQPPCFRDPVAFTAIPWLIPWPVPSLLSCWPLLSHSQCSCHATSMLGAHHMDFPGKLPIGWLQYSCSSSGSHNLQCMWVFLSQKMSPRMLKLQLLNIPGDIVWESPTFIVDYHSQRSSMITRTISYWEFCPQDPCAQEALVGNSLVGGQLWVAFPRWRWIYLGSQICPPKWSCYLISCCCQHFSCQATIPQKPEWPRKGALEIQLSQKSKVFLSLPMSPYVPPCLEKVPMSLTIYVHSQIQWDSMIASKNRDQCIHK